MLDLLIMCSYFCDVHQMSNSMIAVLKKNNFTLTVYEEIFRETIFT